VTGDLDLLISRSLDGDLPAEEERELQSLLASDPSARARYDAMARVVKRIEELPEPETPFAMATRVSAQVEADTKGLAASLHRFGFYFRPATLFVVGAGVVAVALTYTLRTPPQPAATVAQAKAPAAADDGRVTVFLGGAERSDKKDSAALPPASAAPADALAKAAPAKARGNEVQGGARSEPVLVASAEAASEKKEAFAPESDAPSLAAPAPAAPPARRDATEPAEAESAVRQKAATESTRFQAPALRAAGATRAAASVEVVGKGAGSVRLLAPARLEGLSGPFEGSYRLELNPSGRPIDVVRLFGGSGTEPAGLKERLRGLSFGPGDALRGGASVDVKVRLP
jgi:anti-sigma factor RsiW